MKGRLSLLLSLILLLAIPVFPQAKKAAGLKTAGVTSHSVTLTYGQSVIPAPPAGTTYTCSSGGPETITGNNVYRGTTAGGEGTTPYAQLPGPTTTYVDTAVTAGQTYFYQVTGVACGSSESGRSNEVSATIPNNVVVGPAPNAPTGLTGTVQ